MWFPATIDRRPRNLARPFGIAYASVTHRTWLREAVDRSAAVPDIPTMRFPMMSLLAWALFGLVAGAIARFLHPGFDSMGMLGTMMLGILGSLLGGGVAYLLHLGTSPYEPG